MVNSFGRKAVDGPAILQLRKWENSKLDLSEFSEAFISPTRNLLLLLSLHCEALLFPLITGNKTSRDDVDPHSDSLRSPRLANPSRSDSLDDIPTTSGSVDVASDSPKKNCTSRNQYPIISDVKSLAWGQCGDAYDKHTGNVFREFLFISGEHGITVHAFCHVDRCNQDITALPDNDVGQGRWVEWDPETVRSSQGNKQFSLLDKTTTNLVQANGTVKNEEIFFDTSRGRDNELFDGSLAPKKWLKTYLTQVETIKSDGSLLTKFPKRSSYPCSASVVSFDIFDNTSILLDFLSRSHLSNISWSAPTTPLESISDTLAHSESKLLNPLALSAKTDSTLKCSQVFSSSSHRLIGFVLTVVGPTLDNNNAENVRNKVEIFVVVTMISEGGVKWLSSTKLQDFCVDPYSGFEWTDFQFSDNLLICLHGSGLIFVYGAITGEPVKRLDVLQLCGLNPSPNQQNQKRLVVENGSVFNSADLKDQIHHETTQETNDHLCTKRVFKKLKVSLSSLLLAVIDERGVVYIIYPCDYILEESSTNMLLPHLQHFGMDVLSGWVVGGLEIGCQIELSGLIDGHSSNKSSTTNDSFSQKKNLFQAKQGKHLSYLSGFSAESQKVNKAVSSSEFWLNPMRRIFVPTDVWSEDDSIWLSPLGITRLVKIKSLNNRKGFEIVHRHLNVASKVQDDSDTHSQSSRFGVLDKTGIFTGDIVSCTYQGCLYLVTQDGLSVVLPSVSVSSDVYPLESFGYWRPTVTTGSDFQIGNFIETKESKVHWPPWKLEVLDRVILYDGGKAADHMCSENGWDLKFARLRCLQLALDHLKFDEIEQSLEKLMEVNIAEEGILRILFTAVYQIFCKVGNDNEVALASRLLALSASFAIRMIRKYGLPKCGDHRFTFKMVGESTVNSVLPDPSHEEYADMNYSSRLNEMAHFLEVVRTMQCHLDAKCRRPAEGSVDDRDPSSITGPQYLQDDLNHPSPSVDTFSSDVQNQKSSLPAPGLASDGTENLALVPVETLESVTHDSRNFSGFSIVSSQGDNQRINMIPLENPKDMIARWEMDHLDLKTVVKDALNSGRLPLAVLQLHLQRVRDLAPEKEDHDIFNDVRDVGRTIAYDLFLKGETGLAIATLQRLGENIETSLKELLFGTVRRSLRMQIAAEMQRCGFLASYEWKILERITLIERLYPSSGFWGTFHGQQRKLSKVLSSMTVPEEEKLLLLCSHSSMEYIIECGEVDGVVIGPWANMDESSALNVPEDDNMHLGYWSAAAVWSDAWDQRTIDRIVLDQPSLMGVHVPWESQFEYYVCHNDWDEVSKLLDVIPLSSLSDGSVQVNLDGLRSPAVVGCNEKYIGYENYMCSTDELDLVCLNIPNVKVIKLSSSNMCSMWLRKLMEQELAKKFIFFKEYFGCSLEIVPLLSRAGFIFNDSKDVIRDEPSKHLSDPGSSDIVGEHHKDTIEGFHKLVVHHCTKFELPNLLDLYLDHHKLLLDSGSLSTLLEATGDCEWAKWMLLSRVKGHEYDASFSNARSIISHNFVSDSNLRVSEMDEIIRTVDDMAEGGGEMAALATLMHAPAPIQKCLCSGSVKRNFNSSAQCTLENLRPALQRFPTLCRTLVAACFGQDVHEGSLVPNAKNVFGNSALSDFLNWREKIFASAGHDTSLLQMLPCWFSKSIQRLIQLFVEGPFGWQSLAGMSAGDYFLDKDMETFVSTPENAGTSAISWEAAIQKRVEEELYDSTSEKAGFGAEHHLHRGRALAAFNHLLGARVMKLKSGNTHQKQSSASVHGKANVQADVQMLLSPATQSEESLLSSVMPLAIVNFEDSVLVASCAFLLELCGLSAGMLRVNVAALRRISSFYMAHENNENIKHLSPKSFHAAAHEGNIAISLARALADDYLQKENANTLGKEAPKNAVGNNRPSRALLAVLQHLEKVSLPLMVDGTTSGSWLFDGSGDGTHTRFLQKAASQQWSLVTSFCQMHQIPLSTKYLSVLANDNDWVGFLTEAQVGGYSSDVIVQVASKEFSDPRLKIHILTALKSMCSTRRKFSSSLEFSMENTTEMDFSTEKNFAIPAELFVLLGECEKQNNPGEALLTKAKDLRWSLLAIIASCFPDVASLSCLTVWLEITAARETSSIKVNDITSQIAKNVGAAVTATNALPASSRALVLHYNRRNAKRRCLIESSSGNGLVGTPSVTSDLAGISVSQDISSQEERRKEAEKEIKVSSDPDEGLVSLSEMVRVLCEQRLFLPLLRAFEMFLPSCSLLPFIRALQAFSQMRLSEASAHLASFSIRIKEEPPQLRMHMGREEKLGSLWIGSTAVGAADAMLLTCPSAYEKRCLLQLLSSTDFGDGGSAASNFRRLYWKINLAEPSLRKVEDLYLGIEPLDDASLLLSLEKHGQWDQARNWARQLEATGGPWIDAAHHVTETQAEAMVAEWKEFLWDVPEERAALWSHCQKLFLRYSFPPLQAGLFFLNHAEAVEKDVSARELHEMLLLSLQWLSGTITQSNPVYPLHLLREIETRVWLLAVESEAQIKSEGEFTLSNSSQKLMVRNTSNIVEQTASKISKMDSHLNTRRNRITEKNDTNLQALDGSPTAGAKTKRRAAKSYMHSRKLHVDIVDKSSDPEDGPTSPLPPDDNIKMEASVSKWEERVGPEELERAVLSLLEFGQVTAAKQLQHKLSPDHVPSEFLLVDVALKLASISTPETSQVHMSMISSDVLSVMQSYKIASETQYSNPLQVLESLTAQCTKNGGQGLCKRIISVVKAANVLGLSFSEAFGKQPLELLQLLSLKAQDSFDQAELIVQTHSMPPASIAQILAESFLKGLLAAHRGGYMDFQKEEGPAPLLWRISDFLKWAQLCPSEPEIGHALMRLVITGQEIPHACEVELLILAHHFYKSSACLDGVDVLVALAATRVECYVSEGDFTCLARLVTGVSNFHALNFILGILIENGQLELLLQKYSAAESATGKADAVRGFRMAVLTSLKNFNPHDLDACALVYNHFDMKHETAALLESQAKQCIEQWFLRYDKEQTEDLLEAMHYYIKAAEVHTTIDTGNKTRHACAQAFLLSLQIRMPDLDYLNLSMTNARRALVEQSRFQEALIVAEAYNLNQPSEWALALWNQMLKPELTEEFVAEFVAVLPLHSSMLMDVARFYRAEVAARGDQTNFSVWLSPGGLPAEWLKHLARSFRCLLKRTRDVRLRMQLANIATGFVDVVEASQKELDRVPDSAGPLVLRKGHGGAYLPLM
ncbi:hypothetical protein ACHQM5_016641 [Ranunculus cassubicifolius]